MSGVRSHTLKALRELAMIFLVMIERDKKVKPYRLRLLIQIEIRKLVLAQIKGFSPFDLFKSLSKDDDLGYLSPKILARYLNKELGVTTDKEET